MNPDEQLATAEELRRRVRRRSRWACWYYVVFAIIWYGYIAALGLGFGSIAGVRSAAVYVIAFVLILGLGIFGMRRPVQPRGFQVRSILTIVICSCVTALVLGTGSIFFLHEPAYWLAAPVLPSAVLLAGAVKEYREAHR